MTVTTGIKKIIKALPFLGLLFVTNTASAKIVNVAFSGVVTWNPFSTSSVKFIPTGSTFNGSFAYDSDATNLWSGPTVGQFNIIDKLSLTIANQTLTFNGTKIEISNTNVYRVYSGYSEQPIIDNLNPRAVWYFNYLSLQVVDTSGIGFNGHLSDAPPNSSNQQIFMSVINQGNSKDLGGVIKTLEVIPTVPEPKNIAMLLASLGLLGIAVRRNKKA